MPAVSKSQRRFFGMLEHTPGMAKAKGIDMTHEQMHDFAATSEKGLPNRVKKPRRRKSSQFAQLGKIAGGNYATV